MSDAPEETGSAPAVTRLAELDARDDALIASVDTVMESAAAEAGDRWRCGPGRTDCCIGPFPISALDARRLSRGLAALGVTEPERAAAIRLRAEEAVGQLAEDFPGDPVSGILDGDVDELLETCDWFEDLPCPVLDPETGRCDLYRWRPLVCRTFGPPLRVHDQTWKACPYCFEGKSPQIELDQDDRFGQLRTDLEKVTESPGETFVAFAILAPRLPPTDP